MTKTTFYNHFESKDDLILAVLAHQHEMEMAALVADIAQRGGDDPRAQILAIFETFDAWFAGTDFRGCMFLNAATEFPQHTDPIHQAAITHGAALSRLVHEKCIAAGADAFLQKPLDPLQFVSTVKDLLGTSALVQGATR